MQELHTLILSGTSMDNRAIELFPRNLKELDLTRTGLRDDIERTIHPPFLYPLLPSTLNEEKNIAAWFASFPPGLERLVLAGSPLIRGEGIQHLPSSIQVIDLSQYRPPPSLPTILNLSLQILLFPLDYNKMY